MSISQELAKKAGIVPFLKLATQIIKEGKKSGVKGTGPHKVVFISDKNVKGSDYQTGEERFEVEYIFEEEGENKKYRVPTKNKNNELNYFVRKMSEYQYGDELILEYKKIPNSFKGYIDIKKVGGEEVVAEEEVPEEEQQEDMPQEKPENKSGDEISIEDIPF